MSLKIQRSTTVVVPCYNEAARLNPEPFIAAVADEANLAFVFVDDGSQDETRRVLDALCQGNPRQLSAISLPRNMGKAEAVRHGVNHAFERGATLVGYWDADLATPLTYIAEFARVLEKPELMLVLGSRTRLLGHHVERDPLRHYVGRWFATVASLALGLPVYDTQCGAKLFRATEPLRNAFAEPFVQRWTFDVELLQRLQEEERLRGNITMLEHCIEYPIREWRDAAGSKLRAKHLPRITYETALICSRSLRRRSLPPIAAR